MTYRSVVHLGLRCAATRRVGHTELTVFRSLTANSDIQTKNQVLRERENTATIGVGPRVVVRLRRKIVGIQETRSLAIRHRRAVWVFRHLSNPREDI
jgi:hypothetical protein